MTPRQGSVRMKGRRWSYWTPSFAPISMNTAPGYSSANACRSGAGTGLRVYRVHRLAKLLGGDGAGRDGLRAIAEVRVEAQQEGPAAVRRIAADGAVEAPVDQPVAVSE